MFLFLRFFRFYFFSPPSSPVSSFLIFEEQRNERVPPLPRILRGIEDLNIEDRFVFFSFIFFFSLAKQRSSFSLSLSRDGTIATRSINRGEGRIRREKHRSSTSIRLFQFARASQSLYRRDANTLERKNTLEGKDENVNRS